jgi:hypothetical protein
MYTIFTQSRKWMVDENGNISIPFIGNESSGQWKVTGAARFTKFGYNE